MRPLLHIATLIFLFSTAFFLVLPETASAQVWISSEFTVTAGPGAQQETAYCSTSAVDPTTGLLSPAATDYYLLSAECSVTPSTGQNISSAQCPMSGARDGENPNLFPTGSTANGNPTAGCTINFAPQPGVTYTINATHLLWFIELPIPTCYVEFGVSVCWSDPEGFFGYPFKPWPSYSTQTTSITQEQTGSVTGTGVSQDIPESLHGVFQGDILGFAFSSASYTTCTLPTTETTAFEGWDTADTEPTVGLWEQTSTDSNGDNFSGYEVTEMSPTEGEDTCWIPNPYNYPPMTTVTGARPWTVGDSNTWGPDKVGFTTDAVAYYRANNRVPCSFTVYQQMQIMCSDGSFHNYGPVNTLQGIITATTVSSVRAGGTATRRY